MNTARKQTQFLLLIFAFILLNAFSVFAGPGITTYQAKIIKPDGYPLEASNVNFKFTILNPAGSCILYSETYSAVNMASTGGVISFSLGSGVKTYPVSATTFEQVFSNITPSLSCDAGGPGTFTPGATDIRKIVMQFHDGAGWQTLPAMSINAVPYAMYANDALNLGGVSATAFVQDADIPTCVGGQGLFYNGTSFSCVAVGGAGVTSSTITAALGYTPADASSVSTTVFSVSSTVASISNSVSTLTSTVAASFAAITSSQWVTSGTSISYDAGLVGIGTSSPIATLSVGNNTSNSQVITLNALNFAWYGWYLGGVRTAFIQSTASEYSIYSQTSGVPMTFYTSSSERLRISASGSVGIGVTNPTAKLHLAAGTSSLAPLKLSSGSLLTSPQPGSIEYDGFNLYYTDGANARRAIAATAGVGTYDNATTISNSSGNIALIPNGGAGSVVVSATAASTNSTTGALVVKGGVGVSGTLNVSGDATFNGITAGLGGGQLTSNTAYGNQALLSNTTGNYNVAVGALALVSNTTSIFNTAVGYAAMQSNMTGSYNTAVGQRAMLSNTTGAANTALGGALGANTIGSGNTCVGDRCMTANTVGNFNTSMGYQSLRYNVSGTENAAYGVNALTNALGDRNVGVGSNAGANLTSGTNNIAIGYNTSFASATASNQINIGNVIYGANGSVGIGTSAPVSLLANTTVNIADAANSNGISGSSLTWLTNASGYVAAFSNTNTGTLAHGLLVKTAAATSATRVFEVDSGSGAKFIVQADGNIGVGTVAPTAKLHVAAGTTSIAAFKLNSSPLLITPQAGSIEYNGFNLFYTDSSNDRQTLATEAQITTVNNQIASLTAQVSGTTASQWTTSGSTINFSGDVGIGITSPAAALDVGGQLAAGSRHTWLGGNLGALAIPGDATLLGTSVLGWNASNGQGETNLINAKGPGSPGGFTFDQWDGTTRTTRMVIHGGTGYVGIGTTNPAQHLQVSGTAQAAKFFAGDGAFNLPSLTFANNSNTGFYNASGNLGISVGGALKGTWSANSLGFNAGGAGPQLYFTGGNAAQPSYAFNVDSDTGMFNPNASGGSNELAFSTSGTEKVRISSTGNLGVGTSSPTFPLEVLGSAKIGSNVTGFTNTANIGIFGNSNSLTNAGGGNASSISVLGNSNLVSTTLMNFSYNLSVFGNSNFAGNAGNSMILGLNNNVSAGNTFTFGFGISNNIAGSMMLGPVDSAKITILPTNRVGIGTTAPTSLLQLGAGTSTTTAFKFSSGVLLAAPQPGAVEFDGTNYYVTNNSSIRRTIATVSSTGNFDVAGDIAITGRISSSDFYAKSVNIADGWAIGDYVEIVQAAPHAAGSSSVWEVNLSGTRNSWTESSTYRITTTHSMGATWREAPHISDNGYVGNSKCFTVDVNGAGNVTQFRIRALRAGASCGVPGTALPLTFKIRSIGNNAGWTNLSATGTGATVVGMQSMGLSWNIYTGNPQNNGVPAIHANSTGMVGIGTSDPAASLDVAASAASADNIRLRGKTAVEGGHLTFMDGSGTGGWEIDNYGVSGSERLRFFRDRGENNLTEPLMIAHTGYVGVGTNSPTAQLSIGSTNNINVGSNFANAVGALRIQDGSSIGLLFDSNQIEQLDTTNSLYLNHNSSASTVLNWGGGNVGIGTLTPGTRLDISAANKTMISNGTGGVFKLSNPSSANSDYFQVGWLSEDNWAIMTADSGTHRNLVVTPWGGNLGVGNTNPTYKLDVTGNIRISGAAYRDDGVATWALTSDARLKDVISNYDRGLQSILAIDTVNFKYKKDNPRNLNTTKEFPGVIAQQVQKVIPEAVDTEKDGFLSLNTTPIIWAMLNAIKEVYYDVLGVKAENAQLKAQTIEQARKISSLEEENAAVKARLERIEKVLQQQNK